MAMPIRKIMINQLDCLVVLPKTHIYINIYMLYMSYIVYTYTENVWKIPRNVSPHGAFMVFPWVLPSDLERLR